MLKCKLEIRYIRLHFRFQDLSFHKRDKEHELLTQRQHQRTQRSDVRFQGVSGNRH
uniref:Uncharacterized protein MANES_01G241000 n=1 Tax=Rhizophora mucronata TaxID=61149 RepID=A0A2P2N2I7_RHIMU